MSCRDSEHDLLTFLLWLKTMLTIKKFNCIQVNSHENMLLIFFFSIYTLKIACGPQKYIII